MAWVLVVLLSLYYQPLLLIWLVAVVVAVPIIKPSFGHMLYKRLKKPFRLPSHMRAPEKLRKDIVTFYFQGMSMPRSQGAQYTGPEGIATYPSKHDR